MRICQGCSISIEGKHKNSKFCDAKCKDKHWQNLNPERMQKAARKFRESDKCKTYRKQNKEKIVSQVKEWHAANQDRRRQLDKNYHERNKGNPEYLAKRKLHEANRRAAKLNATPIWLSKEQKRQIRDIYMNCPEGHHVDHIIPLQGKDVCGLHVPWNLQYLEANLNRAKGNRINDGH